MPKLITIVDAKAKQRRGFTTDDWEVIVTTVGGELMRYAGHPRLTQRRAEHLERAAMGRSYIDTRFWEDAL